MEEDDGRLLESKADDVERNVRDIFKLRNFVA